MLISAQHTHLVIFDMDGLLVNSEPCWKQAEKEVFTLYGLHLTDELLTQVMGFRLNEVVKHWYNYKPWPNPDFAAVEKQIFTRVKQLIIANATAMPGVYETLELLAKHNYKLALASSSAMELIEVVLTKLQISHYFSFVCSAQAVEFGKPHPAIFLHVAQQLQVDAEKCLVFEDSINGVIAAKAARMKCIAVPEYHACSDVRYAIADKKLTSLLEFSLT